MSAESKTPRTDKFLADHDGQPGHNAIEFARRLEIELDAETVANLGLRRMSTLETYSKVCEADALRSYLDELRKMLPGDSTVWEGIKRLQRELAELRESSDMDADVAQIADDDTERLETELAASHAQNERLLSLVRLQRGELHQKDAISDEEYATLAADVSSRTVLDTHDTLRGEIDVLEKQLQKRDNTLAASHAREAQLRSILESIDLSPCDGGSCMVATNADEQIQCWRNLPPPPVVPLALAEMLVDALKGTGTNNGCELIALRAKALTEFEAWRAAQP